MIPCFEIIRGKDKIMNIHEKIKETVDGEIHTISYNLFNFFQGLLFSIVAKEIEPEVVGGMQEIISHIIKTSTYDGPEGEEYPVYDRENPEFKRVVKKFVEVLEKHDIQSHENIKNMIE